MIQIFNHNVVNNTLLLTSHPHCFQIVHSSSRDSIVLTTPLLLLPLPRSLTMMMMSRCR
ncbi:hypothetical protein GBAR_LOCUS31139 [Geodia barretti]|uniref:Uncharacterized protein n=1 Tax=Geodia barretti TaxID=519541 RepID=A0AA35XLT6_GEOBA|nr:hypothetical protein GBAR_LOCUS31139 [Geodia barretti]